jgi:hypothetical protein
MRTENGIPRITLLSWTKNPIETIYQIWEASKSNRPIEEILKESAPIQNVNDERRVMEVFQKVIDSKIPVAENLDFVFLLENVSISFREQMVRHRIGAKVGPRLGCDIAPDLADSTWWSQSMRILDMGKFADEGRYRVPEGLTQEQGEQFMVAMKVSQDCYNRLVEAGVSSEEAREVIPLGATHRITWKLNLAALQHIIGKRGCQILQLGLWEPVIRGMVDELATKVHPYFRQLICPPCMKGDTFKGCLFKLDNERRDNGIDNMTPCTLWLGAEEHRFMTDAQEKWPKFDVLCERYGSLWQRNAWTGKMIERLKP